jgi:hypothetical protein
MTGKEKGFFDKLKDAVVEHDENEKPAHIAPAAQALSPSMATSFAAPASPILVTPSYTPTTMSPTEVDPEALATVKAAVYVPTLAGRQSNFILFLNMWEALGKPADPAIAVKALQVSNPNITIPSIISDIDQHGMLLDNTVAGAKQTFDNVASQTLGGNDTEIASLTEANAKAQAEIDRHNRETAERNTRLAALQSERAENEAKLNRARARANAAETLVRSELVGMKQLFVH